MANVIIDSANVVEAGKGFGTSQTLTVTCSASDNALVVLEGSRTGGAANIPTGITYNGVALTLLGSLDETVGTTHISSSAWKLDSPATGAAHSLVVTYAASVSAMFACAVPLQNVSTYGTAATAGASTNNAPAVTATGAGSTDLYLGVAMNAVTAQASSGTGQTDVAAPITNTSTTANASTIAGTNPGAFTWTNTGTVNLTGWSATAVAIKAAAGAAPTVTTVNGGSAIAEGATNVAVVGTNFASGMTSAIAQPGVSVSQPTTFVSATAATFNLSMEPAGNQLAFTDATYTTTYSVTTAGGTSTPVSVTLTAPAGLIFQTLASVNPTASNRITATPDLVAGDQLEAAGNAAGTAAIPTGLSLNSDATYQFSTGNTPTNFWVRAYDSVNFVWGPWAQQTIPTNVATQKMLLMGVG